MNRKFKVGDRVKINKEAVKEVVGWTGTIDDWDNPKVKPRTNWGHRRDWESFTAVYPVLIDDDRCHFIFAPYHVCSERFLEPISVYDDDDIPF